ncbi:hypothetical protein ECPA4_2427, partial [Escherichia coli PA4]
MATVITSGQHI